MRWPAWLARSRRSWPLSYVRVRVTAAATLVAMVGALFGSVVFVRQLSKAMENQLVSSGQQAAATVQAQLNNGESAGRAVVTGKNDIVIQILGAKGQVVATDHPRVTSALRSSPGVGKEVRVPRLSDRYVVVARTLKGGQGLIVVGRSNEQVERATDAATLLLAFTVPVGLALLAFVVWLSVGRALRPVEEMRREAAAITATHLERRLAVPTGDDEIPRLATTLNEMLDRIDAASLLQRQFVSDASHELRSPLAAIRQVAEIARDYPDRVPEGSLAAEVLTEEQRMEDLVSALLLLARIDDGAADARRPVDVDDLVLEQARRARREGGPRIDVSDVSAGQVEGDAVLVAQVVANLLTNAVRHAATEVALTLHQYDDQVVLTVDDDGNGISEADKERVFERFVRLDEARARDGGGSGLGLAIVRKVVEELGGSVRVQTSAAGGARFVVSLPAA